MSATAAVARRPATYGNLQHAALSAFWFGSNFLWLPLTTVLIQAQVDSVVPKGLQNTAIGVAVILATRTLTHWFLSLYMANDPTLWVLSLLQGLAFQGWRATGGRDVA